MASDSSRGTEDEPRQGLVIAIICFLKKSMVMLAIRGAEHDGRIAAAQ